MIVTEAGIIGFPKPNYVFKENDGYAVVPVHRTIGMDGHVSVTWFTRDITGIDKKHYIGGRGVIEFGDGEVWSCAILQQMELLTCSRADA